MKNNRLVYSTETGRICPKCQKLVPGCSCKKKRTKSDSQPPPKSDGIIRIQRETKGRKGKTVTTVSGFDIDDDDLKALSKQLKQHCGAGGSIKYGVIVIQGENLDTIKGYLERQGYKVRIAVG